MTSRTGARGDASPLGLVPTLRAQLHVFRLQLVQRFLHVMELFGLDIGQLFEVGQVRGCLAVSHPVMHGRSDRTNRVVLQL